MTNVPVIAVFVSFRKLLKPSVELLSMWNFIEKKNYLIIWFNYYYKNNYDFSKNSKQVSIT